VRSHDSEAVACEPVGQIADRLVQAPPWVEQEYGRTGRRLRGCQIGGGVARLRRVANHLAHGPILQARGGSSCQEFSARNGSNAARKAAGCSTHGKCPASPMTPRRAPLIRSAISCAEVTSQM